MTPKRDRRRKKNLSPEESATGTPPQQKCWKIPTILKILLASLLASMIPSKVSAQSSFVYQTVGTHAIINNMDFNMGATRLSDG